MLQVILQSTIIHLRAVNIGGCVTTDDVIDTEFTLLPDFEEVVGKEVFKLARVCMSSFDIKFP